MARKELWQGHTLFYLVLTGRQKCRVVEQEMKHRECSEIYNKVFGIIVERMGLTPSSDVSDMGWSVESSKSCQVDKGAQGLVCNLLLLGLHLGEL